MVMDRNDGQSRDDKSCSVFESELLFLIARYLYFGPCRNAANTLIEDLQKLKLLPKRIDWLGNTHDQSYEELVRSFPHVGPEHLLKICLRIIPILDKEFPPSVNGVLSLLGAGRQSLLRDRKATESTPCSLPYYLARRHGAPLDLPVGAKPVNCVYLLVSREHTGSSSFSQFVPCSHYARYKLLKRSVGHLSAVYCAAYDKTGTIIITGADDLLVKVWSSYDGRLKATLRGASAEISDITINDHNTLVAAGSCDKIIRVWCLQTTAMVAVLTGVSSMVTGVYFCPSVVSKESYLVSTSNDGTVAFWTYSPQNKSFNPYPEKFHEKIRPGHASIICASFSPGGLFLATGSADHNVRVYLMPDGIKRMGPCRILETEIHSDRVDSIQWCNKGVSFVSGSKDGTALVWKYCRQEWSNIVLKMGTNLKPMLNRKENGDNKAKLRVTMVGWSLDDCSVLTAVSDFTLKVWDSSTGLLIHVLKGHLDEFYVIETHPIDPRIVLSSGHDGKLCIWDIVEGKMIVSHHNIIQGQGNGALFDTKWSPDGMQVVSTDSHGHICVYGPGSDDAFKKIPDELFFHTDYRPLIRDSNHHVLDEQTQLAPHLMPPPFLVDIEGNPYPPKLQRLVPGRETCKEEQLIPNVVVDEDGETQVLDFAAHHPGEEDGPNHYSVLDEMIERLAQERGRLNGDGGTSSRRNISGEVEDQMALSTSVTRERARRSGLRRSGDVEGVRQSTGNWQPAAMPTNIFSKQRLIEPLGPTSYEALTQRRKLHGEVEMEYFEKQSTLVPVPQFDNLPSGSESNNRSNRRSACDMSNKHGYSTRAHGPDHDNSRGASPPRVNGYGSQRTLRSVNTLEAESSLAQDNALSDSSSLYDGVISPDCESSEYSDWLADENMEPPTRTPKRRACKPGNRHRKLSSRKNKNSTRMTETSPQIDEEDLNTSHEAIPVPSSSSQIPETRRMNSRRKAQVQYSESGGWDEVPPAYRPPEWLGEVNPKKSPYFPQMGDEVIYFLQGHKLYLDAVRRKNLYRVEPRDQPWTKLDLKEQELVKVVGIKYEIRPPRLCCLKLAFIDPVTSVINNSNQFFTIKYHDIPDVIDFLVLRSMYNTSMQQKWMQGMKFGCMIEDDWWCGSVLQQEALEPQYPDSPFLSFKVKWDNGEEERLSPWDMEVVDDHNTPSGVGLYTPREEEWLPYGDQDSECQRIADCISKIMELAIAEPFCAPVDLNLYPNYAQVVEYPVDLSLIKARVENKFYRRHTSIQFDARYIAANAEKFNQPESTIVRNARVVSDVLLEVIRDYNCFDILPLYHTMMDIHGKQTPGETSSKYKNKKYTPIDVNNRRNSVKDSSKDWQQKCRKLLNLLIECEDSRPFRKPVDQDEYPDYFKVISEPVDLGTVRKRLNESYYSSPAEFCENIRLIFQNSRNYNTNKRSQIYSMTLRLSSMFEAHMAPILHSCTRSIKPPRYIAAKSSPIGRRTRSSRRTQPPGRCLRSLRNLRNRAGSENSDGSDSGESLEEEEDDEDDEDEEEEDEEEEEEDSGQGIVEAKPGTSGVKRPVNGVSVPQKYSGSLRSSRRASTESNQTSRTRKPKSRNLRTTSTSSHSTSTENSDGSTIFPTSKRPKSSKVLATRDKCKNSPKSSEHTEHSEEYSTSDAHSNYGISDNESDSKPVARSTRNLRTRKVSPILPLRSSRRKRKITDSDDSGGKPYPSYRSAHNRRKITKKLRSRKNVSYLSDEDELTHNDRDSEDMDDESEKKVLYSLRREYAKKKSRSNKMRIDSDDEPSRPAPLQRSPNQPTYVISTRSRNRVMRYREEYCVPNSGNVDRRDCFSDGTSNSAPASGLNISSRGRLRKPSSRALAMFE